MAEYYPLLAKAVGSLPNSTPETRRIVYERARKALIGQLRTLHPPVPDEDVERESVALDRAIERLETELAADAPAPAATPRDTPGPDAPAAAPVPPPSVAPRLPPEPRVPSSGAIGPLAPRKPIAPLRPRPPRPAAPAPAEAPGAAATALMAGEGAADPVIEDEPVKTPLAADVTETPIDAGRPRVEAQRPIAPQPPASAGPKRPIWILPTGIVIVVLLFALAAWKLRVRPETIASKTPVPTVQAPVDSGKIADRVGGAPTSGDEAPSPPTAPNPNDSASKPDTAPKADTAASPAAPAPQPAAPAQSAQQAPAAPGNPELPVAHRAAMLVEAPDLPSKVQTFPGTVVWKLNNVNAGPSDAVGLSVEADIDLPDDRTKATVTFEKNTDSSLPASHTIKVRFTVEPGSYSGDIKQISVPQMRREGNSDGEPLAGVTVPVIQNSFLVGLSPGNAETANLRLLNDLPWIDVPILLTSGKIAKLTFEKGASGQRDISEALADWQKQ